MLRPAPMTLSAPKGVEAALVYVAKPVGPPQGYGPQSASCSAKATIPRRASAT